MRELRSRLKVERGKVTVVCSCEFCTVRSFYIYDRIYDLVELDAMVEWIMMW